MAGSGDARLSRQAGPLASVERHSSAKHDLAGSHLDGRFTFDADQQFSSETSGRRSKAAA
jgi:hypothetical protein